MIDYMREALACYHAGAYRGCIVMSYLALFDDLRPNFHSPGLIPSENPRFSASFACADEIVVLNAQEFRR
jgi:hypothetical protein